MLKSCINIVVVAIVLFALSGLGFAEGTTSSGAKIKTLAVMPFGSFGVEDLSVDITQVITDNLVKQGFDVISQDILAEFLVERRVRGAEFLDRPVIRAMGTTLNIDALLMGSVDILRGGENPQVSINAQMIDCTDAGVIWANSISRTGADYTTFLGLGKITSLDKLVRTVVKKLLEGLPGRMAANDLSLAPFELMRASFSPRILRGGETARVSLQVKEILGKVRDIKAFVLDDKIDLRTRDGKWYSGSVTAPAMEGTYPLKIYVTDRWNRLFSMDAMAGLTVQNRPPEIALSVQNRSISPNNDGVRDRVLFIPEILKAITLKGWKVEITDGDGRIVRSEQGMGALPEGFVWRGVDDQYKAVKDGIYFCRLIAEDEAGNTTSTPEEKIVVDATPPKISVEIADENEKGVTLALKTDDVNQIGYWELIVYNTEGVKAAAFDGKGDIPSTLMVATEKKKLVLA
ncbi:MAG: hypothetical protein JRD47_04130 [Deltaproteobacteria bacterium]|nr:hypothetical protein [Deltaproteobacteria bacterium]